ncbi:MAG: surface-adhesin E family protein [Burkholderiales bacterium]
MKALLHALYSRIRGAKPGAAKAAPSHHETDISALANEGPSPLRRNVPGNPWAAGMVFSYAAVLALLLVAAGTASAADDWKLVSQDAQEMVFVDRANISPAAGTVKAWVLKSSATPTTLGDNWYPHRSKKLLVEVRCEDRAYRINEWVFTEGALGHGRPVWADVSHVETLNAAPEGSTEALIAARICSDHLAYAGESTAIIR